MSTTVVPGDATLAFVDVRVRSLMVREARRRVITRMLARAEEQSLLVTLVLLGAAATVLRGLVPGRSASPTWRRHCDRRRRGERGAANHGGTSLQQHADRGWADRAGDGVAFGPPHGGCLRPRDPRSAAEEDERFAEVRGDERPDELSRGEGRQRWLRAARRAPAPGRAPRPRGAPIPG